MDENRGQLSRDEERLIADLHESKYFAVLVRLVETLDAKATVALKNRSTPDSEMRHWQGYASGIVTILLEIAAIAKRVPQQND